MISLKKNPVCGVVLCGGMSSRMGADKCFLHYNNHPQYYEVFKMLSEVCESTLISCNKSQADKFERQYFILQDDEIYRGHGPIGGILTAFNHLPETDLLVVGCDYPFLTLAELKRFYSGIDRNRATAFYNDHAAMYEPLLAYYPSEAALTLNERFKKGRFSLQQYLKIKQAIKYNCQDIKCMTSIDEPEEFLSARYSLH